MSSVLQCECNLIDWSGGPGNYKYISTGKPYQPYIGSHPEGIGVSLASKTGICCGAKHNGNLMSAKEYGTICMYIPGGPGSKFPQDVYEKLLSGGYSE